MNIDLEALPPSQAPEFESVREGLVQMVHSGSPSQQAPVDVPKTAAVPVEFVDPPECPQQD